MGNVNMPFMVEVMKIINTSNMLNGSSNKKQENENNNKLMFFLHQIGKVVK